jgi:hypothetical protein
LANELLNGFIKFLWWLNYLWNFSFHLIWCDENANLWVDFPQREFNFVEINERGKLFKFSCEKWRFEIYGGFSVGTIGYSDLDKVLLTSHRNRSNSTFKTFNLPFLIEFQKFSPSLNPFCIIQNSILAMPEDLKFN